MRLYLLIILVGQATAITTGLGRISRGRFPLVLFLSKWEIWVRISFCFFWGVWTALLLTGLLR